MSDPEAQRLLARRLAAARYSKAHPEVVNRAAAKYYETHREQVSARAKAKYARKKAERLRQAAETQQPNAEISGTTPPQQPVEVTLATLAEKIASLESTLAERVERLEALLSKTLEAQ